MILRVEDIFAAAWMKSSALRSSTGLKSPFANLMREPRRNASRIGICSTGQGTLPSLEEEDEEESFLPDLLPLPLYKFSLLFPLLKLNLT